MSSAAVVRRCRVVCFFARYLPFFSESGGLFSSLGRKDALVEPAWLLSCRRGERGRKQLAQDERGNNRQDEHLLNGNNNNSGILRVCACGPLRFAWSRLLHVPAPSAGFTRETAVGCKKTNAINAPTPPAFCRGVDCFSTPRVAVFVAARLAGPTHLRRRGRSVSSTFGFDPPIPLHANSFFGPHLSASATAVGGGVSRSLDTYTLLQFPPPGGYSTRVVLLGADWIRSGSLFLHLSTSTWADNLDKNGENMQTRLPPRFAQVVRAHLSRILPTYDTRRSSETRSASYTMVQKQVPQPLKKQQLLQQLSYSNTHSPVYVQAKMTKYLKYVYWLGSLITNDGASELLPPRASSCFHPSFV